VFDMIGAAECHMQFQVKASYFEIYCEKIRDLMNPSQVCVLLMQEILSSSSHV
jgi:hypothetical protein